MSVSRFVYMINKVSAVFFFPEEIPEQPLHENQQCQHTNGVLQKRSLILEAVKEPDNEA